MWGAARVSLIVPAYRESRLIGRMLGRVPGYVDEVIVVDDASDDGTAEAVRSVGDARVRVVRHAENRGVGAAIVSGYRAALAGGMLCGGRPSGGPLDADVLAVMAGDDQMHPDDLEAVIAPVARGEADYVKGNRFRHAEAARMPLARRAGGELLSLVTRLATGLAVSDTQCGFTALSARAAALLPLETLWPRYGYPNDLLGMLAANGQRVSEVSVRPVYADETSGLRPWHALGILGVIARRRLRGAGPPSRGAHEAQASMARSTSRSA